MEPIVKIFLINNWSHVLARMADACFFWAARQAPNYLLWRQEGAGGLSPIPSLSSSGLTPCSACAKENFPPQFSSASISFIAN